MSTSELFSDTLAGASAEILIMLGTSFILGILMHWIFASNWKKRHNSARSQNRSLSDSQKVLRIKNDELESQLQQMAAELKVTTSNYKRSKTNLQVAKEKYSELMSKMAQFDFLASDHQSMKRKLRRLEKIKLDQKEQIDNLKVELLNSRIKASATPAASNGISSNGTSNGISKKKAARIDDLTLIPGIGPKTQSILNENGIQTFTQLGRTGIKKLREMMDEAGTKSRTIDPRSWTLEARELNKKAKV